ncbi:MAG TPA: chemotaxis protein CheW [Casimicrobiaceae bacterium]|nr:chemotaxis protein CheW [Casimicrobiaceae bacterium]
MARAAKLNLRSFQQELATRLASKTAAQVESSRLGLDCAGTQWLIRLADAGEVIAVPPIADVPLTKPWFRGLANIRGNLYSVIDFAGFLGAGNVVPASHTRLVLFGARAGDFNAGIIVSRVLGLRNLAELAPAAQAASVPAWYAQRWIDAQGNAWQEIDLAKLAREQAFLQVSA